MYSETIAFVLPEADPADHAEIENIMRDLVLHSELDWVPTGLFRKSARLAHEVLLGMREQQNRGTQTPSKQRGRK
jgi:hypothetical protein